MWKKVVPSSSSEPVECQSLNSSGSLITLSAIESVGLLNDTFFMDHGETEWCFRAISKGYKIFGTSSIEMEHLMGDRVYEYWFFGKKRMPYRSPLRHYYIIRNGILMQKMPYVPIVWKFWNVVKILFTFLYFGILGDSPKQHRRYILRGIHDGLRGAKGKLQI
jgi:rhamnosyltransferase